MTERTGAIRPVFLVKGDDAALVGEAVDHLVSTLVGDDDPALVVEDLDAAALGDDASARVLDACLTPPFLTARRVVLARNAGAINADGAGRIVEYLEAPLDTTSLVLVGGGGTIGQKLSNAVKKAGELVDAGVPSGRGRTTWLVDRLKDAPVKLDSAAGTLLAEHLGEDLGRLSGILDAVSAAYGEGARVGADELEPFLGSAGGVAPWDLTDAIDRGETDTALRVLHRMLNAGDRHPLVIMATLHRHYAAMMRLDGSGARSDQEAADLLGLRSTFPAKKALSQSRRLGSAGVRRAMLLLAEADIDLRGNRAWPDELVLEVLVARLTRLTPAARAARR